MEQIKYRAWNGKKFIDFDNECIMLDCQTGELYDVSNECHYDDTRPMITKIENAVVMQYIGLEDKYGNEIYEGDIVPIPSGDFDLKLNGIITYDKERAGFYIKCGRSRHSLEIFIKKLKVIGNIYENPELIRDGINYEND